MNKIKTSSLYDEWQSVRSKYNEVMESFHDAQMAVDEEVYNINQMVKRGVTSTREFERAKKDLEKAQRDLSSAEKEFNLVYSEFQKINSEYLEWAREQIYE